MQRQIMKSNFYQKLFGGVLLFLLCAAVEIHAQGRFGGGGGGGGFGGGGFGGFGGFGGGGGNNGNRGGTSGSGQYNNNGTVGNAVISVDPATHNLIVIADKQTSEQIRRVIENLDTPMRQVLIKVVFLEVQRNDSSEIGVQGTYTGNPFGTSIAQLTGFVTNYAVGSILSGSGSNAISNPSIIPTSITPNRSEERRVGK